MPNLTARFHLPISSPCFVSPEDKYWELPRVETKAAIGQFTVCLAIVCDHPTSLMGQYAAKVRELEVSVTRDEMDAPPVNVGRLGPPPYEGIQSRYLSTKYREYQEVAQEAANRFLRYFRERLLTPSVRPFTNLDISLFCPTWTDHQGESLTSWWGPQVVDWGRLNLSSKLGARRLSSAELPELSAFVGSPDEQPLDADLLCDAQTALFEGKLRRAVLEIAISTEIMVKRKFFTARTPAGVAFDYLEDKAKVTVKVLELLDVVALEAFGQSYRLIDSSAFKHIDHLFRCRNKIAHRGVLSYRDDGGRTIVASPEEVGEWWSSASKLRGWLGSIGPTSQ